MDESRNIVLIGFMGAGKTSLGKAAARILGWDFLDTDDIIVSSQNMSVNEIFAEKGEEYFRGLETETVRELADRGGRFVLSVGGGLPLRAENRPYLRQTGCVVYIRSDIRTLTRRLARDKSRPILRQGDGELEDRISRILSVREPLYMEAADVVVENSSRRFGEVACEIAALARPGHMA